MSAQPNRLKTFRVILDFTAKFPQISSKEKVVYEKSSIFNGIFGSSVYRFSGEGAGNGNLGRQIDRRAEKFGNHLLRRGIGRSGGFLFPQCFKGRASDFCQMQERQFLQSNRTGRV